MANHSSPEATRAKAELLLLQQLVKDAEAIAEALGSGGGGIPEAPIDGTTYGRNNATWVPVTGGGGGEANVTSNVGTGIGLALPKVGVNLPFKSLIQGTNITLTDNGDDITIAAVIPAAVTPTLDQVLTAGNTSALSATLGGLTVGPYTLPSVDGTSGQVLTTDGLGTVTWETPATGGVTGSGTPGAFTRWSTATNIVDAPVRLLSGRVEVDAGLEANSTLRVDGISTFLDEVKIASNIISTVATSFGNVLIKPVGASSGEPKYTFTQREEYGMGFESGRLAFYADIDINNTPAIEISSLGQAETRFELLHRGDISLSFESGTHLPSEIRELNFSRINGTYAADQSLGFIRWNTQTTGFSDKAKIDVYTTTTDGNNVGFRFSTFNATDTLTETLNLRPDQGVNLSSYGAGAYTGTATFGLAVTASGEIVEVALAGVNTLDEVLTAGNVSTLSMTVGNTTVNGDITTLGTISGGQLLGDGFGITNLNVSDPAKVSVAGVNSSAGSTVWDTNTNSWVPTNAFADIPLYTYDTNTTMADPTSGKARTNNADISLATQIAASKTTNQSVDLSDELGAIRVGATIAIREYGKFGNNLIYKVTGITDNGTWFLYDIQVLSANNFSGNNVDLALNVVDNGPDVNSVSLVRDNQFINASGGEETTVTASHRILLEDPDNSFQKQYASIGQILQATPVQENDNINSDTDNYALSDIDNTTILRLTVSGGDQDLTGIVAPSPEFSKRLTILNADNSDSIKIKHNNSGSSGSNRFRCPDNSEYELKRNSGVDIIYDTTSNRWRIVDAPQ